MMKPVFALLAPSEADMQEISFQIKAHAVNTVNMLVLTQCACIRENMKDYTVHILSIFAQTYTVPFPSAKDLRLRIVQGITNVLELESQIILDNLQ